MKLDACVRSCLNRLGPAPDPPTDLVAEVVAFVATRHPNLAAHFNPESADHRRLVNELVVAYGCGYYQIPLLGLELWGGYWPKAFLALLSMVKFWVSTAARWLEAEAFVSDSGLTRESASDDQTAFVITWLLIKGGCNCSGRHPDKSPIEGMDLGLSDYNALQRLNRCLEQHRLIAWKPSEVSLRAFVARAVKGEVTWIVGGRTPFAVGALVKGIYYFLRSRETGLLDADALAWECWRDGHKNLYGLPCQTCLRRHGDVVMASSLTPLTKMRWLVLPSECGGGFSPQLVQKCRRCHHLYPASKTACPFDGTRPDRGERPAVVWALTNGRNIELDAFAGESNADALLEVREWNSDRLARLLDAKASLAKLHGPRRLELEILLSAVL